MALGTGAVIANRGKVRGKLGQRKVQRYWPGRAPEWWAEEADEFGDIRMKNDDRGQEYSDFVTKDDDRRLIRLADCRIVNREEARAEHRRIRQAEIVEEEDMDMEEEDEDTLEERRQRNREQRLLQMQQEEELVEGGEEEEEEESEYETDSEEELMSSIAMVKPVFILKSERDTIVERQRLEAEERALEEQLKRRLEELKAETKQIVVEKIREEQEIQTNLDLVASVADMDPDDELNEAGEYEAWKDREIARIKREREDREPTFKAKEEEIDELRNTTEEERRKKHRKWMPYQRYYHKGGFFQSDPDDKAGTAGADTIYSRDFSAPKGEDKMDKSILPVIMQVKHFGRSGRTKWTHLVNEDTTDWNNPWTYNDPLRAKYNAKMAAANAPIAKPIGSKKLKDWET